MIEVVHTGLRSIAANPSDILVLHDTWVVLRRILLLNGCLIHRRPLLLLFLAMLQTLSPPSLALLVVRGSRCHQQLLLLLPFIVLHHLGLLDLPLRLRIGLLVKHGNYVLLLHRILSRMMMLGLFLACDHSEVLILPLILHRAHKRPLLIIIVGGLLRILDLLGLLLHGSLAPLALIFLLPPVILQVVIIIVVLLEIRLSQAETPILGSRLVGIVPVEVAHQDLLLVGLQYLTRGLHMMLEIAPTTTTFAVS